MTLPPIALGWREAYAKRGGTQRKSSRHDFARAGSRDTPGISFQFPPNWDDGSGKIKHVESGPFKGRVIWTSRREAREIAKRYSGQCNDKARYDD